MTKRKAWLWKRIDFGDIKMKTKAEQKMFGAKDEEYGQ